MKTTARKFEGKGFWCDSHRKLHNGVGYIVNSKAYCLEVYQKMFPNYQEIEKEFKKKGAK